MRIGYSVFSSAAIKRLILVIFSLFLSLVIIEVLLRLQQFVIDQAAEIAPGEVAGVSSADDMALVMPESFEKREVATEGAVYAYYWQNILHVHNADRMRRTTPFPPKRENVFRIIVVGDSLTYGVGVDESSTYPRIIESELNKTHNIEVFNLGVEGVQSEDILQYVKKFVPELKPDLVVYGMCLNDFLQKHIGEYDNNMAYKLPLPDSLKKYVVSKTLTAKLFADLYNRILLKAGLRANFVTDVLHDFHNTKTRFRLDMQEFNEFVTGEHLPPVIAMVLNQYPKAQGPDRTLTEEAEQAFKNAGMTVISSSEYLQQHDGELLSVNQWEAHPNEEAHRLFASYFIKQILSLPELTEYKKGI